MQDVCEVHLILSRGRMRSCCSDNFGTSDSIKIFRVSVSVCPDCLYVSHLTTEIVAFLPPGADFIVVALDFIHYMPDVATLNLGPDRFEQDHQLLDFGIGSFYAFDVFYGEKFKLDTLLLPRTTNRFVLRPHKRLKFKKIVCLSPTFFVCGSSFVGLDVDEVVLPNVKSIPDQAFMLSTVRKVVIPQAHTIGVLSFGSCKNLVDLGKLDMLIMVKTRAFYNCSQLARFPFCPELYVLTPDAFDRCTSLVIFPVCRKLLPCMLDKQWVGGPAYICDCIFAYRSGDSSHAHRGRALRRNIALEPQYFHPKRMYRYMSEEHKLAVWYVYCSLVRWLENFDVINLILRQLPTCTFVYTAPLNKYL